MALVSSRWRNDDWALRNPFWDDRLSRRWDDWPMDWPSPREVIDRVSSDFYCLAVQFLSNFVNTGTLFGMLK